MSLAFSYRSKKDFLGSLNELLQKKSDRRVKSKEKTLTLGLSCHNLRVMIEI